MQYLLLDIDWTTLNHTYGNETLWGYIWFGVIVLLTIVLKRPLAALLTRLSGRVASKYGSLKHRDTMRNMLLKPVERLLQTVLYFVACEQIAGFLDTVNLHRPGVRKGLQVNLGSLIDHVFLLLFIIFLTQFITRVIDFLYHIRMNRAQEENNLSREQMLPLIKEMSKLLTWTMAGFWVLGAVFHVNVPALITGLGIGGVAIALAGKETVENFFAAFTILSDKPFITGDTIKLGDVEAVVERIGFRSTRLRNTDGSAYIVPNQNLVSQNLINLSNRSTRGVKLVANIKYGISHEALNQMTEEIKKALHGFSPVAEPVNVSLDNFEKETFQLIVSYHLPHPLPMGYTLPSLKHSINIRVFEIVNKYGQMGIVGGSGV